MQVISLTSRVVVIVATEVKRRRKWDRDNLLHMQEYEVRGLILVNVKILSDLTF